MAAYIEIHVRCHLTLKEMAAYIESHLRWHLTKMAADIDPKTLLYKKVSIDNRHSCKVSPYNHVKYHLTFM